jgi:hypothetical protein
VNPSVENQTIRHADPAMALKDENNFDEKKKPEPECLNFEGAKNRFQETNSARLNSLAGRYNNSIPTRFLAPINCLKIPALECLMLFFASYGLRSFPFTLLKTMIRSIAKNQMKTRNLSRVFSYSGKSLDLC